LPAQRPPRGARRPAPGIDVSRDTRVYKLAERADRSRHIFAGQKSELAALPSGAFLKLVDVEGAERAMGSLGRALILGA
jgi:hypothetical protein